MKYLFLAFAIVAMACSKHNDPAPTYKDISGHWVGQSSTLVVDFTITKANTTFTVSSGSIKISGDSYAVTIPEAVTTDLFLHNDQGWIQLNGYTASSDFKKITTSLETYYEASNGNAIQIHESITLTRK